MPALFCLIGFKMHPSGDLTWPVVYRVDEADAIAAKEVCERQRDEFIAELEPIHQRLRGLITDANQIRHSKFRRGSGGRAAQRESINQAEIKNRAQLREERDREAAVNAKFARDMLDPLYPTSTNGSEPAEVVYKIIAFWDDPREMGDIELMKQRALLHGSNDEDDDEPDEDL